VAFLRKGDLKRAIEDYTQAIRLAPKFAEAYRNRGYAYERRGQPGKAAKDFKEARRLAAAVRAKVPPLQVGDAVVLLVRLPVQSGDRIVEEFEAGEEFSVAGFAGGRVLIKKPANAGPNQYGVESRALVRIPRPPRGGTAAVKERALAARLRHAFQAHEYVRVTVHVPGSGKGQAVTVTTLGLGRTNPAGKAGPSAWSCQVRSPACWGRASDILLGWADHLKSSTNQPGPGQGPNRPRTLQFFFHQPTRKHFGLGKPGHVFLSRQTQRHLEVQAVSDYPANRHVLIINEPHSYRQLQFDLLRGLESFFADNPFLLQRDRTCFLAEGWPAGKPLPVEPLVRADPRPDDRLVWGVLDTFLIPAYVAYEWKHRCDIPIYGHEDPELYRIGASLAAPQLIFNPNRQRLWVQSVFARNRAMTEALLGKLRRHACPILFVGGLHLNPMPEGHRLNEFGWKLLAGTLPPADYERLKKADKRGIGELLRERNIGYCFLQAVADPFASRLSHAPGEYQYQELFRAQLKKDVRGYLRRYVGPPAGTTVAPDPEAAARAVVMLQRRTRKKVAVRGEPFWKRLLHDELGAVGRDIGKLRDRGKRATPLTREEIVKVVTEIVEPFAVEIRQAYPGALVGYRGSLARGRKGRHKGNAPFDPSDWDVDAFVVDDLLALKFRIQRKGLRPGWLFPELKEIEERIDRMLRARLTGLRPKRFAFRFWTRKEYAEIVQKDAYVLLGRKRLP
jgi:filamentous hemagglutinin